MASLIVTFETNDRFTPITRRTTDDLPAHVKGTAYWLNHNTHPSGYYYTEASQPPVPVEFINDTWYILHFSTTEQIFRTRASYRIDPNDPNVGLGRWPDTQAQPLEIRTTNLTAPRDPAPESSELEPENHQSETWGPAVDKPLEEITPVPGPLDDALAATLDPIVSLQGSLPLDPPQEVMSVNVTTTTPAQNAPLAGVLRYCRNVHPTWVKFNSKDTKESEWVFEVLSTKSDKRT